MGTTEPAADAVVADAPGETYSYEILKTEGDPGEANHTVTTIASDVVAGDEKLALERAIADSGGMVAEGRYRVRRFDEKEYQVRESRTMSIEEIRDEGAPAAG